MVRKQKLDEMKNNPHHYFNFGFTYNDYKAFLLKAVWMRAERIRIERLMST
jgi:hypothetical protein